MVNRGDVDIKPVAGVQHGYHVYSRQIDDVVGREERNKKIIDELELLFREVLAIDSIPESLRTRIITKLELLNEKSKNYS